MKKSKIFMAAAGLVIAIGGAFATKAVNRLVVTTVYYQTTTNGGLPTCATTTIDFACTNVGPNSCITQIPGTPAGTPRTAFRTRLNATQCTTPFLTSL